MNPGLGAAHAWVETLLDEAARYRTGLMLLGPQGLGASKQRHLAARLMVGFLDYTELLSSRVPTGSQLVGVTRERLLEHLGEFCVGGQERGVLVANLDFGLAKLSEEDREVIWSVWREAFAHPRRAVIVTLPAASLGALISTQAFNLFARQGRVHGELPTVLAPASEGAPAPVKPQGDLS